MKKFLILFSLVIACVTLFSSCSKDDDSNSTTSIVGKWKVISIDETKNGEPVNGDDLIENQKSIGTIIEFNSNLTYTVRQQNMLKEAGVYEIKGSSLNVKPSTEDNYHSVIFNISGNELHYYYTDSPSLYETYITEVTLIKIK